MQVRLWAQGLTIGVVIAAAALTHAQRAQATEMRKVRHASVADSASILTLRDPRSMGIILGNMRFVSGSRITSLSDNKHPQLEDERLEKDPQKTLGV